MFRYMLSAAIGFILTTANACADEPKVSPANLEALKYAVTKAEQRGENVGTITEAVVAFEKSLTKIAGKPGEAPPELTALRDAVEAAAKKGENVEAISKELGLIEKVLTGREYERPKPPEPKLEPVPPLQRPGRIGGFGARPGNPWGVPDSRPVIGAPRRFTPNERANGTTVLRSNDRYTILSRQDGITYLITGSDNAGLPSIVIRDDDQLYEADDVIKLPDEYRNIVEDLLKKVNK